MIPKEFRQTFSNLLEKTRRGETIWVYEPNNQMLQIATLNFPDSSILLANNISGGVFLFRVIDNGGSTVYEFSVARQESDSQTMLELWELIKNQIFSSNSVLKSIDEYLKSNQVIGKTK